MLPKLIAFKTQSMTRHKAKRIVTKMVTKWSLRSPQELLASGSATYTLDDPIRVFIAGEVVYDESQTPMYLEPRPYGVKYESLVELYKENPSYRDSIILDGDHYLKTWNETN